MIKPTVGRVVWYWPSEHDIKDRKVFTYEGSNQPFAATVAFVHNDRMVNLAVVDHNGMPFEKRSVTLRQSGDVVTDSPAGQAEWMPYQTAQAKRAEAVV